MQNLRGINNLLQNVPGMYFYHFYLIYIVLGSFFINACQETERKVKLILNDSVSFQITPNVSRQTKALFCHEENGRRYMVYDDEENNFIRIFDIDSLKEFFSVPIPVNDKEVFPFRFGFYIKNFDSIFIPVDGYRIFLVNRHGSIIKKIDYSELKNRYFSLNNILAFSRFSKGVVAVDKYLYFIQNDSRLNYLNFKEPDDYKFCFRYNMVNDSARLMNINLPDDFWEKGKHEMSLSMAYNGEQFIYAPQFSNEVYTSKDNEEISSHYTVKSKFVDTLFNYFPSNRKISFDEYSYYLTRYSYYIGLLWDKYRHVYYRLFWPGLGDQQAKDRSLVARVFDNFPQFGIMVLDEDFNVLDEIILPKYIYSWDKYFVSKEGLYISADNPERQETEEYKWTFHIYSIQWLEYHL